MLLRGDYMDRFGDIIKKYITISVTEYCNLACTYCYEHHKTNNMLSFETAKEIIDREMSANDGYEEISIDFFGGEPFTEFELIKKCVEYILRNQWNKKFICFASTNGTLIHGEVKEWLQKNKDYFWCGLSFDGTKKMQNINRSNSADLIDLDFFKNTWPEQPIKMTISQETLPNLADGIIYLHKYGFDIYSNLAVGIDWSDASNLEILENQLMKLIEYYLENPDIKPCSILDKKIETITLPNESPFRWCGAGTHTKTYDINGNLYPCHFFMPITLGKEKAVAAKNINFSLDSKLYDENCDKCKILNICPSCYGSSYQQFGDVTKRDPNMCKLNKVTAKASAYLQWRKIENYGVEKLASELGCSEKSILDAIFLIQQLEV